MKLLKTLLIEDNQDHAFIIQNTLLENKINSSILHLSSSSAAVNYIKQVDFTDLPNIIFLDIKMPEMSGLDILSLIKENKIFQDIPVLMLSTSSQESEVELAYKLGANTFFSKPANFDDFSLMIKQIYSYWESAEIVARKAV